ncbi:MAG: protein translocase subunit SecD [Nanoarchaeota archaeon]
MFTGKDIITVYFDPQRSGIQYTGSDYKWFFTVQLSAEGAQRFALITQNIAAGGVYLESPISMYLDGNLIDSLLISSSLRGRAETEISISGSAATFDDAENEKLRLQSILRSGALPTSISIVQLDTISPTLGSGFLQGALLAGAAAIAGVSLVVLLRYRKMRIVLPLIVFSLSEVIIILGIAALIGWTIDIAAIAGIIAVVGTGVDSQIIIVDQAMKGERVLSLSERMKRAFFIVFGAAGTVIVAMLPLMVLGFGLLRGFAITTIIGVLAAVLITRPAFGVIIQRLVKE